MIASDRDAYATAYAELHEAVRRFLTGAANRRSLARYHAAIEVELRYALDADHRPPTTTEE